MIKTCNFMVILFIVLLLFSGCFPAENQEEHIMKEQTNNEEINTSGDKEKDNANSAAISNYNKHDPEPSLFNDFNENLNTYLGKGFTIKYPANAKVIEISDVDNEIIGPSVSYRLDEGKASISGPFYSLRIKTFPNPGRLTAEEWAREYILTAWQEAKKHGEVLTSLPVTDDGKLNMNRVKKVTIANQSAFRVDEFEPDCIPIYYYFSNNEQIVVISFYDTTMPLRQAQRDIYSLILNTFHFNEL